MNHALYTPSLRAREDFVVEDEEVERYIGQVDLEGKPIFRWILVGFWAGDLGIWSKDLKYLEFWEIYGSESFSENMYI